MRRIDAGKSIEAIQKNICEMSCDEPRGCSYCRASDVVDVIYEQPTVDAEPVRHGRWIERNKVWTDLPYDSTYNYECSNCGHMDTHGANVEVPYCWHCGAKMDEAEE